MYYKTLDINHNMILCIIVIRLYTIYSAMITAPSKSNFIKSNVLLHDVTVHRICLKDSYENLELSKQQSSSFPKLPSPIFFAFPCILS